jgi:hypothetical protein
LYLKKKKKCFHFPIESFVKKKSKPGSGGNLRFLIHTKNINLAQDSPMTLNANMDATSGAALPTLPEHLSSHRLLVEFILLNL